MRNFCEIEILVFLFIFFSHFVECVQWASPRLVHWQVKLALQMASVLYREADYETAKQFLDYGIEMAKPVTGLEYYWAVFSLANATSTLKEFH